LDRDLRKKESKNGGVVSQHEDFLTILMDGCRSLNLSLSNDAAQALELYFNELRRWNRKINLIAKKTSASQIVENHFLDSLVLLPYIEKPGCTLVDVGTGAGFPGLVCKAASPDLCLKLVEPRLKRVSFLRHITRTLDLDNVEVMASRIEDIDRKKLSCTCITSRAVADIEEFLQMVAGLAAQETEIICMKGPKWQEELEQASACMLRMGLVLNRVEEFVLPFSAAKRALLFFQKS
jgi:16S rRNA (guanine527-N7)-methyltransferase